MFLDGKKRVLTDEAELMGGAVEHPPSLPDHLQTCEISTVRESSNPQLVKFKNSKICKAKYCKKEHCNLCVICHLPK